MGFGVGLDRFGIGRFEAEATGGFDRTKQDLQNVQGTAGLEPVRMRRNSAHGMEGYRTTNHLSVGFTPEICPFAIKNHRLFEGDTGKFSGQCANAGRGDATAFGHRFGRILRIKVLFRHLMHNGMVRDTGAADMAG